MTKAKTKKNLQVVIEIKEKDKDNTTVEIGYKNTEEATDIEKMTGANIYNVVCEAIKNMNQFLKRRNIMETKNELTLFNG